MHNAAWDPPKNDLRSLAEADKDFCTMARIVNEQKLVIAVLAAEVSAWRAEAVACEKENAQLKHNLAEMMDFRRAAS
jgi:hypothetical protein